MLTLGLLVKSTEMMQGMPECQEAAYSESQRRGGGNPHGPQWLGLALVAQNQSLGIHVPRAICTNPSSPLSDPAPVV